MQKDRRAGQSHPWNRSLLGKQVRHDSDGSPCLRCIERFLKVWAGKIEAVCPSCHAEPDEVRRQGKSCSRASAEFPASLVRNVGRDRNTAREGRNAFAIARTLLRSSSIGTRRSSVG